jgi:hypothetical protein
VYFGLYGLDEAEIAEHIADRDSYSEAFELAQKPAPGIAFPAEPTLLDMLMRPYHARTMRHDRLEIGGADDGPLKERRFVPRKTRTGRRGCKGGGGERAVPVVSWVSDRPGRP